VVAPELALSVPARGLVLLVGASGAGKTTFARRHFAPTEVLSSDGFRGLVADDEGDQTATPAAFDVLTRVLAHRLRRGRLSVVDATNVSAVDRRSLLRLAALARRPAVAIVFDLPEAVCQERNARRAGRVVAPTVVRRQVEGIRQAIADRERLRAEGFAAVHVLDDAASIDKVSVTRDAALPRPAAVAAQGSTGGLSPRPSAPRGRRA
jgi:protein phosphatase